MRMRALLYKHPMISHLLLWHILFDSVNIGLARPKGVEVKQDGRHHRDLSHGLEGLLDEGDGSEIRRKDQRSEAASKLGRRVSEVIGGWFQGGLVGRRRTDQGGEKQRENPVSWWQKIARPDNKIHSGVDHLSPKDADNRREGGFKKKVILPTFSEVVALFEKFYPYMTQYRWKVKEDTVEKVFLKILQDISRIDQRSSAIVNQIIKRDVQLYTKSMVELGIDPYFQRKYNFLIKDMLEAKKKTQAGLEDKIRIDQRPKEDFDKDMLNNMKAMYAHPWGRPGNFETLKNSHVYPQMFNKLDGSMHYAAIHEN